MIGTAFICEFWRWNNGLIDSPRTRCNNQITIGPSWSAGRQPAAKIAGGYEHATADEAGMAPGRRRALRLAVAAPVAAAAAAARSASPSATSPSVETLNFLIAVERAKERGVDIEVTYFKSEDIAAQAVVGGQADVGVGAPYTVLQKVKAPIRIFYQMSTLRFFPVVNTEFYQDWKDLNGQEIAVHSRGSGTEAIMQLMAKRNGIDYSNISYVPGSEVRATALLQGHVKATIVDSANWRILEEKAPASSSCCRSRTSTPPTRRSTPTPSSWSASRRRSTSWSRSCSAPGARSTPTRRSSRSCARSTICCPTCPPTSRPRSSPYFTSSAPSEAFPEQRRRRRGGEGRLRVQRRGRQARGRSGHAEGRGLLGPWAARSGRSPSSGQC